MRIPGWVIAVAILMILFGGCGAFSDAQKLMMPQIIEMQKGMVEKILKNSEFNTDDLDIQDYDSIYQQLDSMQQSGDLKKLENYEEFEEAYGEFEEMMQITPEMRTIIYISIGISILYMLSGALLFTRKPFSIYLVYFVLAISILLSIVEYFFLQQENIFWGITLLAGLAFSMIIDIVFIIIVATGNKDYLNPQLSDDQEKVF